MVDAVDAGLENRISEHIANTAVKAHPLMRQSTLKTICKQNLEDDMSDKKYEPRKWSTVEFIIGFLNKKLLVFGISTVIVFLLLFHAVIDADPIFRWIMGGGWLLLGIIFMLSSSIEKAVENAKISLELKAGTQAIFNGEISKILDAMNDNDSRKKKDENN